MVLKVTGGPYERNEVNDSACETSSAPNVVTLPGSCCIQDSSETRALLLAAVESSGQVLVDASRVERIDTTGIQLLCALHRELSVLGRELRITASEPVLQAARVSGIHQVLPLQAAPAANVE